MQRHPLRLRTGQKLGSYELLTPVARGGTGMVWAARLRGARGFQKLVAIEPLLPAEAEGDPPGLEQRLLDEVHTAALIQHSNVVQTLELGDHSGNLYLVTEWVEGESLSDLIECTERSGGVPLLVAVNLVAQILRGLQAAHELKDDAGQPLGVAHKDLSPHNVLVTYSGTVKLVDFGIAWTLNQRSTGDGEPEAKAAYLPPERVLDGAVDQRSDLFAVGVLLYQLTTGCHPFRGATAEDLRRNLMTDEPPLRPSRLVPNYSRTLEAVVLKALEKERDRRWPCAEEMRLALQRGVPQAFELGFENQLRTFMIDTVGDRALRKREALRRAELVVDAGGAEDGTGASSTSASSLRGIAIDTEPGQGGDSSPLRAKRLPTLRPLLARSVPPPHLRRPLLIASLTMLAVVSALLGLRSPVHPTITAATAPGSAMVDLAPPRPPGPVPASAGRIAAPSATPSAVARATAPPPQPSASAANRHPRPPRAPRLKQ